MLFLFMIHLFYGKSCRKLSVYFNKVKPSYNELEHSEGCHVLNNVNILRC